MKSTTLLSTLMVGLCASANAALTYTGGSAAIPDGNLSGWSSTISLPGVSGTPSISDVQVTLNISGGYNGDLYAYLSYDGRLITLLNRIGADSGNPFGSAGAGMDVTLADGHINIHSAGGEPIGTYAADGAGTFATTFGGVPLDPGKPWTLFIADVSSGGGITPSTLNSWSLTVTTAVPEPSTWLGGLGALAMLGTVFVRRRVA